MENGAKNLQHLEGGQEILHSPLDALEEALLFYLIKTNDSTPVSKLRGRLRRTVGQKEEISKDDFFEALGKLDELGYIDTVLVDVQGVGVRITHKGFAAGLAIENQRQLK